MNEKRLPYSQKTTEQKEAIRAATRRYYERNKSEVRRKARLASRVGDKNLQALKWLRAKAKAEGIPFNLTLEDVIAPAFCPVLGIPIFRQPGGGPSMNSPSVDRIDANKGYVKGNVIVVSQRANSIKSNAIPWEIIRVGQFYEALMQKLAVEELHALSGV